MDKDIYIKRMQRYTKEAARWTMESGVAVCKTEGKKKFDQILKEKWYVVQRVVPTIDEDGNLPSFALNGGLMFYNVRCLHRVDAKEEVYEYWLFNVWGEDLGDSKHAEFYITKADHVDGKREVVHSSRQFFESHTVDGVEIRLPINDLKLLCDMQAWQYPDSYKGHKIAHLEVQDSPNGYFIVSDSFWGKVGHMFRNVIGSDRSRYRKP